jgi:hypothetical protein
MVHPVPGGYGRGSDLSGLSDRVEKSTARPSLFLALAVEERMTKPNLKVVPYMTHANYFFPCKSCSNILTKECFDDCVFDGNFKHYRQRPGTGIKDLPAFPLEEVLNENDFRNRLMAIGIYLTVITDYLQHQEEYEKRDEYYRKNGSLPEDFTI